MVVTAEEAEETEGDKAAKKAAEEDKNKHLESKDHHHLQTQYLQDAMNSGTRSRRCKRQPVCTQTQQAGNVAGTVE